MIRSYKITDKPSLIEIFQLNTPEYFYPHEQKDLEEFLAEHADTFFVVEIGNKIVGSGGYHFPENKSAARISWYMFHPEFRGKGLGRKQVEFSLEEIRKEKSVKTISVWTSNLAYRFYEKFGFINQEIKKDFWGPGMDLYRMEMGTNQE